MALAAAIQFGYILVLGFRVQWFRMNPVNRLPDSLQDPGSSKTPPLFMNPAQLFLGIHLDGIRAFAHFLQAPESVSLRHRAQKATENKGSLSATKASTA